MPSQHNFTEEPFSGDNIKEIHQLFEKDAGLYSIPLESFKNASINDPDFEPEFSMAFRDEDGRISAAFMGLKRTTKITILKREVNYKFSIINLFVVARQYRRKGIGSAILSELLRRMKKRRIRRVKVMASPPNYLWPGLDPRYTAAYFFLKKNKFKRKGKEHVNLVHGIPNILQEPPKKLGEYSFTRIDSSDIESTKDYIKSNHMGMWPREFQLSIKNKPFTTFIAKDGSGEVIGFASHSIGFPGSFGPTGVKKSVRGKGIGSILLKWCVWDLKQQGLKQMIIRWVVGDTMKFYCKSLGARIDHVYWTMKRRI